MKRLKGIAAVGLMLAAFAYMIVPASAVHDTGVFELDGNATRDNSTMDDWDNVCHEVTVTKDLADNGVDNTPNQCTSASDTHGAAAVAWASEPNPSASIFTGGGSKDPIDISSWAWKDAGGLPDKDNLKHAFASRYSLPADEDSTDGTSCSGALPTDPPTFATTCEVLFFGSDRFDNSGDAQQGFWFFQNQVTLSNTKNGGGFKFNGVHRDGDVLIISDFSNGGTTSTINVYQWDHTVSGNLRQLEASSDANCLVRGDGDGFCGIVNGGPGLTDAPWSDFLDKSGNSDFLNGEFYEGGVNLTALGLGDECFASVMSETRSSTSTTATLKDFVLGQFANCTATLATTPSSSSVAQGTPVHDTATVTGSSSSHTPSGTVTFYMCSFAYGTTTTCDGTNNVGTSIGTGTLSGSGKTATADSPNVNTSGSPLAPGRYCFRAEWPGDSNYLPNSPATKFVEDGSGECFIVTDSTSATSAQKWLPNDSATVSSAGGTALDGSLVFNLREGDCTTPASGTVKYTKTITVTNQPSGTTFTTDNSTTFVVVDATEGTYHWEVKFTPSNSAIGGFTKCETTTITITD